MNKEEILKMEAGREMDKLVHRNIFNLKAWYMNEVPHYSTSISATWRVVERFGGINLSKRLQGNWYCEFLLDKEYGAAGETAPAAICRAALLAVMEE